MSDSSRGSGPPLGERTSFTIDELSLTTGPVVEAGEGAPRDFFFAWFQLFRTAQIHALGNRALEEPIRRFSRMTRELVAREGHVSLQAKDRAIFFNSVKIKLSSEDFELASYIFELFDRLKMGGFLIEEAMNPEQVRQLLRVMVYAPPVERTFERIRARLAEKNLPVRVNRTLTTGGPVDEEAVLERRAYTFLTYSKLVVLYRGLLGEDAEQPMNRTFLVKKITRTVLNLVDICLEDDHTFLGVASAKSGDAYEPHHAANTTVLSIALGEKIGLGKVELADLGLAAVFHDIGLRSMPAEILDKAGSLGSEERSVIESHTLRSVEFLLGEPSFDKSVLQRIVTAFEHHAREDGGGYPTLDRRPHLFSRIVAITDAFDALTTDRPWRSAYLPDEALGLMLEEAGEKFDPLLLKVFVNTLGIYPVGTLVRLDSGELAVVVYSGGDPARIERPVVAVLDDRGRSTRTIDLAARDEAGGYRSSIVASEDPTKYGLTPSAVLASAPVV